MSELTIREIQDRKRHTEQQIEDLIITFQEESGLNVTYLDLETASERQMDGFRMSVSIVNMRLDIP